MGPLHLGPNPTYWCPQKKRKFGHRARETRGTHSPRKGHVRIKEEGGHQQAKERGLGRNQTCQNLDLRF